MLEERVRNSSEHDKLELLNRISKGYLHLLPGNSLKYGEEALRLSRKLKVPSEERAALRNLGMGNILAGNFYESIRYFNECLELVKKSDDKRGISTCLNNLAVTYSHIGDNEKALHYYLRALEIFEDINYNKGIAASTSNIGIIYKQLGEYDQANEYYKKSLEVAENDNNQYGIAAALNNIGEVYHFKEEYSEALKYFEKALNLAEEMENKQFTVSILNNIGMVKLMSDKFREALHYFFKAFRISDEIGKADTKVTSLINIARTNMNIRKFDAAHEHLLEALEITEELKSNEHYRHVYSALADLYYHIGDYKKAFEAYKKFSDYKDIVLSEVTGKKIAELRTKYEVERKEKEAEIIRKKNSELQKKNVELEKLNETKNKFFSIIAHDLRSPFNSLIGMMRFFAENVSGMNRGEIVEISSELVKSSEQVKNLIDNLLNWAQLQMDGLLFIPTHFNLSVLVDENKKLLENLSQKKNITIHSNLPDELDVYADRNMINSVIQNIIVNSIKFTSFGGRIEIQSRQEGKFIHLEISDNGVGIPEDKISKLFKVHTNISTPGTDSEKGTGLGLILCREFVEKNGGSISIRSMEGEGTVILISIPSDENPEKYEKKPDHH